MQFECGTTKKFKVKLDYTFWEDEGLVWLNNIVVPAKLRNKGIGTNCMREFIGWLDKNGYDCKLLYLKENQVHWYEHFGFVNNPDSSEMFRKANKTEYKDINIPSNKIESLDLMFEEI